MATLTVPPNADMVAIANAAGCPEFSRRHFDGISILTLDGVSQAVAEAALAKVGNANQSPVIIVSKKTIVNRLTDEQAGKMTGRLETTAPKMALMWAAADKIWSTDDLYPVLRAAFVEELGEDETNRILAPEG